MKYFKGSFLFAGFGLLLAFLIGLSEGGMALAGSLLVSAIALSILETSVSLDNAVVNAKYLENMNERSKKWFISWGMIIAVFGMRLFFPVLIVCLAAWTDPISAVKMALFDPKEYAHHMEQSHHEVMAFGASFLLMVALEFFFNAEKETHWIPGLEQFASWVGKFPQIHFIIATPLILLASFLSPIEKQAILFSGFGGMLTFYLIHGIKEILEAMEEEGAAHLVADAGRLMIGSLIFLEVLDASFSFDGVIGAFAITDNFLIIAIGLGIGAMFVRSLTIYLVEKKTMSELKYIEHGAFLGIGWLVAAMVCSMYGIELGEAVVAGVAAAIIAVSALHSYFVKE